MGTARTCQAIKSLPSLEYLRTILDYDPETGIWTWVSPNSSRIQKGQVAGTICSGGYVGIRIDGRRYLSHRLAFLWMTGNEPPRFIDHRDHDKTNCRWANLRAADARDNAGNMRRPSHNTSGIKGVSWHKDAQKWTAMIRRNGHQKNLGLFVDKEEAAAAYAKAAQEHFGSFACFD